MDGLGDLLGGLGDALGGFFGDSGAEAAMGMVEMFSPEGRRGASVPIIAYERYLCGKPRVLDINDR